MSRPYDAIIIGAGHNGLTCACYLTRAGLKVLVLEQYKTVGGMTITEEETLPGFWSDIHASGYQLANLSPVPHELGLLDRYELIKPEIPFSHAFPNGDIISVGRDIEKTVAEIARYSQKDAETWRALMKRFQDQKQAITAGMFSPPVPFTAAAARFAESSGGMEAYRFSIQSVRSWANQALEEEATKSLFASFATFLGAYPDDPCGAEMTGEEIVRKMQRYEWGDSVFVMFVALDSPINYKAGPAARQSAHVHLSEPSLDFFARIYFQCCGGALPSAPMIVSWNDSAIDPSRAPAGKGLMKFVVLSVPYNIKADATGKISGRTWLEAREPYADYLVDYISTNYIPDLKAKILGGAVF